MDSRDRERDRNARKERALERMLPDLLAPEAAEVAAGAAACPDAEILAAFYERSLDPDEMSHWRAHFATCHSCQLSLAALAASDPYPLAEKEVEHLGKLIADATVPPLPGERPVRAAAARIKWPWFLAPRALAPMAAAAAFVAAIGITIHSQRVAMILESQKGNSTPVAVVAENNEQPSAPAPQVLSPEAAESRGPSQAATKKTSQSPAPAKPAATPEYIGVTVIPEREMTRSGSTTSAAPPPPPELPPPDYVGAQASDRALAESGASPAGSGGGVVGGVALPAPAPAAGRVASAQTRREAVEAEAAPPAKSVVRAGVTAQGPAMAYAPAYFTASSPDGQAQWRFGPRGLIERSTNANASGTTQPIWTRQNSPLRADLLAGSAPSTTVCWIVGRAGAILRTTDGATWQVISSPASAMRDGAAPDWVSVSARDANSATITSADGRSFSTSDVGKTWQPQ
ncbi:MAG: WD40/YVTN/BNR-like repeat-containing protein [Candidatus Acidiferrales bacterium]